MVNLLICMIPLAFIAGVICALKSVSLGLKWQLQTKAGKEPELKSPISPIVEAVQAKKDEKRSEEAKTFIEEVLYGERR